MQQPATPAFWMDIAAANTTAQYPTNGRGGISTSAASAIRPGSLVDGASHFVVTAIQVLASTTGVDTVTFTDAAGATFTLAFSASAPAQNILPATSIPNVAAGAAGLTVAQAGHTHPMQGIDVGTIFKAAQDQSATWSVRVWFTAI